MKIRLKNVSKTFGDTPAVRDVSLEIASGELFFLLGPSGCGKTTLLRMLAGFADPGSGEIWFGDQRMNDVPVHKRNLGMVFQNYALWPHMTVAQNVAYGLETRNLPAREVKQQVEEALTVVQMQDYSHRLANQLSGGQQQRVALARALAVKPDLLLLDEPLSNLDARLRAELREEIRRIHGETRITALYVTHDQKEALSLASRIGVMREGRIIQVGTPRETYWKPASRFVADFVGETSWISGRVESTSPASCLVRTPLGTIQVITSARVQAGDSVALGVRPESLLLHHSPGSEGFSALLRGSSFMGDVEQHSLEAAGGLILRSQEHNTHASTTRVIGQTVRCSVRPEEWILAPSTE